jgi:hypothetical protein
VLLALFPAQQADLDAKLAASLAQIPRMTSTATGRSTKAS